MLKTIDKPTLITLVIGSILLAIGVAGIRLAHSPQWIRFFDNVHWTVGYIFGASLAWLGYIHAKPQDKSTTLWFALGLSAYSVGQILWDIQVYIDWNPFPGPSDLFFLMLGLFCSVGLLKARLSHLNTAQKQSSFLDISTLVIVSLSITLALYLDKRGSTTNLQLAVMIAYPVFLLTASCITAILIPTLRLKPHPSWITFSIGLAGSGFAWLKWNDMTLDNALLDGAWYNTLFSFSAVLMGLGARYWRLETSSNPNWDKYGEAILRLLPLVVVIGVAMSIIFTSEKTLPPVVVSSIRIGAIAVIILAVMRQSLSLKERDRMLAAEKAMHESNVKLRELVSSSSDCIFAVKKIKGEYWYDEVNGPTALVLGHDQRTLLSAPIRQVLNGPLADKLIPNYEKCFQTGTPMNLETRFDSPEGPIWFDTILFPVQADHQQAITHVFGIGRNMTARRKVEIALQEMNQRLEQGVKERTEELAQKNAALEETLQHLHLTQQELVNSEKLASLGALVAGISHELNTPIGNCVTVLSSLDPVIKNALQSNELINKDIMADIDDGCQILQRNLNKAIHLITSFKQVAVDQTSAQRRTFDLAEVVREVLLLQQIPLKHTTYTIETSLEPNVSLNSYPGPLGQILQNLLANACIHAFEGRQNGLITIKTSKLDDRTVLLSVTDNGVGIPIEHLPKIFDPFFTTKLGQGGSGLGLNIVHNIATGILGGKINVISSSETGTCFEITMPTEAPQGSASSG